MTEELGQLLKVLADWSEGRVFTIYVFGSRVRGDHHTESDVDLLVPVPNAISDEDLDWWCAQEEEGFKDLAAVLPGRPELLERNAHLAEVVLEAAGQPFATERNVVAVFLPPKPRLDGEWS